MTVAAVEAFFLPGGGGAALFALHHVPNGGPVRGALLYLHPFAEEMNKVRRMAALQSRALAQAGFAVLQLDLRGCGDSSGELAQASWDDWRDDAAQGLAWLRQRHPDVPAWLWGARAGGLLASELAAGQPDLAGLLLWAPVPSGRTHLQQFLRIRSAGALGEGGGGPTMEALRATLDAGGEVEVAGYRLPGALARGLGAARLQAPPPAARVVWLEVSPRAEAGLPPAAQTLVAQWQTQGLAVQAETVNGPAFWQTVEIEDAPALIAATLHALDTSPTA